MNHESHLLPGVAFPYSRGDRVSVLRDNGLSVQTYVRAIRVMDGELMAEVAQLGLVPVSWLRRESDDWMEVYRAAEAKIRGDHE